MKSKLTKDNFFLSRMDVLSSYTAQLVQPLSTILILPFLLKALTSNEIGLYFLMGTIAGMVALLDFGFSTQFSRNFTYVLAGSKTLLKEGVHEEKIETENIDYNLLATLILAAKYIYRKIALVAFLLMISFGTVYVYYVTQGFKFVNNSLFVWLLFSVSTYLNLYFSFYQCLLRGKGLIKEFNTITILARIIQVIIMLTLLYLGFGLISVSISNFIFPIILWKISNRAFFNPDLIRLLEKEIISKESIRSVFDIIWFNGKKLGLVFVGTYLISKVGLFVSGIFLPLSEVASYGMLLQIFSLIVGISSTYFNIFQTRLNYLRISGSKNEILNEFSYSMLIFYFLFIGGTLSVMLIAPLILSLLHANVILPEKSVLLVYATVLLLEQNHSYFAMLISSGNKIPFVKPSLISGFAILIGIIIWFKFVDNTLWGLIIVPGFVQLTYNNWKWPMEVFKDFNISIYQYFRILLEQSFKVLNISQANFK